MNNVKVTDCPTCGNPAKWSDDNKSRPFCCERCKLIDFGEWANENHRIEGETIKNYLDEENEDIQ